MNLSTGHIFTALAVFGLCYASDSLVMALIGTAGLMALLWIVVFRSHWIKE